MVAVGLCKVQSDGAAAVLPLYLCMPVATGLLHEALALSQQLQQCYDGMPQTHICGVS